LTAKQKIIIKKKRRVNRKKMKKETRVGVPLQEVSSSREESKKHKWCLTKLDRDSSLNLQPFLPLSPSLPYTSTARYLLQCTYKYLFDGCQCQRIPSPLLSLLQRGSGRLFKYNLR